MLFTSTVFDVDFSMLPRNDNLKISDSKLLASKEGFNRGNMFSNEYVPYKNYKVVQLVPTNEYEKKLFKVMEYSFALNDLNLYLDLNPKDETMYRLFQTYVSELEKAQKDYAVSYGPVILTQDEQKNYEWMKNPWPWDNQGGTMYV